MKLEIYMWGSFGVYLPVSQAHWVQLALAKEAWQVELMGETD